jgi:iron complex transport system ATP-binding protein
MDPDSNRRWPSMSQGERGRALIARALMSQPRCLLLDELATGLDIAGREHLLTALDALAASDPALCTVMVTHQLGELPPSTSHAALMRSGRVMTSGPIPQVLTSATLSAAFDQSLYVANSDGRWVV